MQYIAGALNNFVNQSSYSLYSEHGTHIHSLHVYLENLTLSAMLHFTSLSCETYYQAWNYGMLSYHW